MKIRLFTFFLLFGFTFILNGLYALPPAPTIDYNPNSVNVYTVGTAITPLVPNTKHAPTSFSVSAGTLPAGLAFDVLTGIISGTPTAIYATATVTITASSVNGSGTTNVTFTVNPAPPAITYTPSTNVYTVNTAIASLTPANSGGAAVSYTIVPALPAGLAFSTITGVISGTPTIISVATTYTITAINAGGSGTTTVNLTVNPKPPVISYTPSTNVYTAGTAITALNPVNTGGAATSYSVSPGLPAGLSLNTVNGQISGTPTSASPTATYTITATNAGGAGTTTVTLTVNQVPIISYTPSTNVYNVSAAITPLTPTNTGGAATTWSISTALPAGLAFNTATGVISGTPTAASPATNYTVTATNSTGTGTTIVRISVVVPPPPVISYTPSTNVYMVGTAITNLTPANSGGAAVSYSINIPLPAGLSFSTTTGVISGNPTVTSPSTTYTITATNGGGSGTTTVNLTVNPKPPVITYTPSTNVYTIGVAITPLTPANSGGAATSYTIGPALPAGLVFSTTTGVISGTPTVISTSKVYTITATNVSGSGTTTVNLTVNPPAPVISYSPSTNVYMVGTAIASLTPSNTGGAVVSYAISPGLPAGLFFSTTTGVISGNPTATSAATTYTITATNAGGSGTTTVNLTVNPKPPVISYTPSTNIYITGTAITPLTPANTGGAAASYSIDITLPAGLSLNTVTGVISGTPTAITSATIYTITATNVSGSSSTTVNITTNPPPPIISYTPNNVTFTVGTPITPMVPNNTGGPATSYGIGPALPAGLTFNTTTGVISGTPTVSSTTKNYPITAFNAGGSGNTKVKITIVFPVAPIISYSPAINNYTVGTAITTLTPNNIGGPVSSYTISTALPAGLSFNTTTGVISGTPTIVSATTIYTITGTNAGGTGSTTVTLTVKPQPPVISYTPSTNVYSVGATITPLTPANTGGAATSYSIGPALPAGLSFNTSTGVISGTPTAISAVKTYTITAVNAGGSGSTTVQLSVNNNPPAITYSPSTVSYSVGTAITPATPINTGGAASSFTITGGTLPSGLSFSTTTGVISGTPTIVFPTTTFTIKATNAAGSSSTSLIITVSPHAPIISYTPSTNAYPVGAAIATLAPVNTGGAVAGYSYTSTGTLLTGATLAGPSLMTIDASGNIYVANWNNRTISRWNSSHTYLGTFGTGITMSNPEGIVFDSFGNAYVEDTGSGCVYKFNSAGVYQSTIITGLNHPLGISINASNQLFIATYVYTSPYTSSVDEYNTSGTLLLSLPNAQMNESDGVAVDQSSGNIFVLNRGNNLAGTNMGNVTEYSASGAYIGVFSSGYSDPLAISVDNAGNVFVADSHNNEVKIYSSNGVLLNTLTGFNDVEGFVADGSGNLYVSDFTNNTVKEFLSLGGYSINKPLPPGLSFNSNNGQITGTPTGVFPPTTYTVTAYNITGSGTTTVTLSCYASYDWVGVTSTNWNTPSNWLSGVVPTSTDQALIGVNRTFNYFPNIPASSGTVNVGSIAFGETGGKAAGVVVNTGSTLNVLGGISYQSDGNSGLGYTCTISGAGTLNADRITVAADTTLAASYTQIFASSVAKLNVAADINLSSSESGGPLANATFNLTGGTMLLTGTIQTTNTANSVSSFNVIPTTTATLQLANVTALSGLSATGTNVVNFDNAGATVEYSGAAQTTYTDADITGLAGGVNYKNIKFSGTGIKTPLSGNLNIDGDYTDALANDASNFVDLSAISVNFTGTTQVLAGGAGNGTVFYDVDFSGAGTKTMSSGLFYIPSSGTLSMSGSSVSTILNANGLLTLNSDATGSASIAPIPAGPSITGVVNVQRYITGGKGYRGYRLLSSPVYAGTVASNNVYSLNYVQTSSYITGDAGGGFDKTGNPTLYLFREDKTPANTAFTNGNFWGVSAINNTPSYNYYMNGGTTSYNIPVGGGFMYFFRGNRASAAVGIETVTTYVPVSVTMTATGTLNQGQIVARDWYTPSSAYLAYTGTGAGTNVVVRGFNLVGNPYASSIDWELYNNTTPTSGIYANNVGTTFYALNPATNNYDTYQVGGAYTNHGTRVIVSGQGFFVLASSSTNPQLIFNEDAKSTIQNTGLNLFMSTKGDMAKLNNPSIDPHLRLQIAKDSINTDDMYIGFKAEASSGFVDNEDAPYKPGNGKVSLASISSDNVRLAINKMPLPQLKAAIIPLCVTSRAYGTFTLNMTELESIPQIYEVWLMDRYKKDSLDLRDNKTYAFNITADTNTYGNNRFQLVIRQNKALGVHLLDFTAVKAPNGAQTSWKTENEQNYTSFTVERSTNNGATFEVLGGVASTASGVYSFLDTNPNKTEDMYRLKLVDLNGNVTYSNVVTLMYAALSNNIAASNINVYPNPASSVINLAINETTVSSSKSPISINANPGFVPAAAASVSYGIEIVNNIGSVIKTATSTQSNWQDNISNLMPGTYVIQVVNKNNKTVVGKSTFVKL